ncbi:MAG TPA: hypothetical protein ENK62_05005 [Chromatiales bacterium]|nr:hypothetical protein [Chromatiales bacterium]
MFQPSQTESFSIGITGGDGRDAEHAVVIEAPDSATAILLEKHFLHVVTGAEPQIEMQRLCERQGRSYDVLHFRCPNGRVHEIWFDITGVFSAKAADPEDLVAGLAHQHAHVQMASLLLGLETLSRVNTMLAMRAVAAGADEEMVSRLFAHAHIGMRRVRSTLDPNLQKQLAGLLDRMGEPASKTLERLAAEGSPNPMWRVPPPER